MWKLELKFLMMEKDFHTKKMNEVFARGFRLDEQTQGTGLGLKYCERYC